MPDNDPLESLDNFPEGLHVNALPASEVRRRGDRMRRRNTALATVGGVVAAAVFIGTPVALLADNDGKDDVQPAPSPSISEDAQPGWLTEIPPDFPLADGFPETNGLDGSPTEVVDSPGPHYDGIGACQTGVIPPGQVDTAGITYTGESEDHSSRTLVLLGDEAAAASYLDEVRELIKQCPTAPMDNGEDIYESALVDLDLGTEDSVVVAQQVRADDGLLSQLTITEFAQSGNALFVEKSYGSAGGQEAVEVETARLKDRSATVLAAMCVFSADPCSTTSITPDPDNSEAPPPVEESLVAIPDDFPLAQGMGESAESDVQGPGPDVEAGPVVDVCGTDVWAPSGVVQRLAVRETSIEYLETRELVTFISADEPADSVTQVRDAVTGCPRLQGTDGHTTKVLGGPEGYDSFTWGYFADEGLGGGVYQVTRVGSAVLVIYASGEASGASGESLQILADTLTETTLAIAPELCVFTEDGCA